MDIPGSLELIKHHSYFCQAFYEQRIRFEDAYNSARNSDHPGIKSSQGDSLHHPYKSITGFQLLDPDQMDSFAASHIVMAESFRTVMANRAKPVIATEVRNFHKYDNGPRLEVHRLFTGAKHSGRRIIIGNPFFIISNLSVELNNSSLQTSAEPAILTDGLETIQTKIRVVGQVATALSDIELTPTSIQP